MEILLQPGHGFINQNSFYDGITSVTNLEGGIQLVYRFSSLMDVVLRNALLRTNEALQWQLKLEVKRAQQQTTNQEHEAPQMGSVILPVRSGSMCIPGRKSPKINIPVLIYGDDNEFPLLFKTTFKWGSNYKTPKQVSNFHLLIV